MIPVPTLSGTAVCLAILGPLFLAPGVQDRGDGSFAEAALHQDLFLPGGRPNRFELEVVLDGEVRTLVLEKRSLRSTRFKRATREQHSKVSHPVNTYRGTVKGWEGSIAAATLGDDGVELMIIGGPSDTGYLIDPSWTRADERGIRHAVSRASAERRMDETPLGGHAGIEEVPKSSSSSSVHVVELAFDADHEFYLDSGSTEAGVVAAVEALVNRVNAIYEYYFGMVFEVGEYEIREVPGPYSSPQTTGALLSALKDQWCVLGAPFFDVQRDVVHLFTGRVLALQPFGQAFDRICSQTARSVTLERDTRFLNMVHELGHNMGACHCNNLTGPGNCSIVEPDCGVMCNPSCGFITWTFSPLNQGRIANRISIALAAGCLTSAASSGPPSFTVSPNEVEVIGGSTVQLVGSNLDQVLTIDWEGVVLDVLDFTLVDDSTIEFTAPPGTFIGTGTVVTEGAGGPSSATFEFVECAPRVLDQTDFIYTDYFPEHTYRWTYCGPIGAHVKLLYSRSSNVEIQNGVVMLENPTVLTENDLLPPDSDSLGIAEYPPSGPDWSFEHPTAACSAFYLQLVVFENGLPVDSSPLSCNFIRAFQAPYRCDDLNPCP